MKFMEGRHIPYRGKVVDEVTGEPIEGVVVQGIWYYLVFLNMWKNGEETMLVNGQENGVYDFRGRVTVTFQFERHLIQGLKKMKVGVGLALCVMLAMALGRVKENQAKQMRSLVWSRAARGTGWGIHFEKELRGEGELCPFLASLYHHNHWFPL